VFDERLKDSKDETNWAETLSVIRLNKTAVSCV
jgi:hypothetical protein